MLEDKLLKIKKKNKKFKETGEKKCIYRNELDKACFQYDMAYGDFKYLERRVASDKVLSDKAFNIAKTPKYDRNQSGFASTVYKFSDKKSKGGGANNEIKQNEQLAY